MNIKSIQDEIAKLEREKTQLEVKDEQIKAEKAKLVASLKEKGLTEKELDGKIAELTEQIKADLGTLGIKFDADAPVAVAAGGDSFEDL